MNIEKIDSQKASEIIEKYSPIGLYYYENNDIVIAIDNSSGHCNVEEFSNIEHAIKWLNGDFEMSDYIDDPKIVDKLDYSITNQVEELKNKLDNMDYSLLIKALISMEKNISDPDQLDKMYQSFMKSDANLLNNFFDEIDFKKTGIDDRLKRANYPIINESTNSENNLKTNHNLDEERE